MVDEICDEQRTDSTKSSELKDNQDQTETANSNTPSSSRQSVTPFSFRMANTLEARRPRRPSVVGTGPRNSRISAFSNVSELFVSNLEPTTSVSDMVSFVKTRVTIVNLCQI